MLDTLDQNIVAALVQDGRRPFVRIAAELGVSEASVRQRVARLTADGVMHIMAVTNPLKLGYDVVCMLGLNVEKGELEAAGTALGEFPEVTYLVACTGRYDYLVEVTCRDNRHLLDFMGEQLGKVPGVRYSESFGYLAVLKESYRTSA
ncbi:MAG: Lrp/AsnC family transcriptional regulator, regulator for asnA, asnC and gidA [Gaiellales bacterium]|jgi:Lrp/AsnC family transcriptional regulator for asnA, asnC and gidA|nr:Lrp/AsnC family transcriptional regulator, regulator for asnA, asnC and gidA [Gaiellales bacterium]